VIEINGDTANFKQSNYLLRKTCKQNNFCVEWYDRHRGYNIFGSNDEEHFKISMPVDLQLLGGVAISW